MITVCLWLCKFQAYPSTLPLPPPRLAVVKSCVLTVRHLASKGYPGMSKQVIFLFLKERFDNFSSNSSQSFPNWLPRPFYGSLQNPGNSGD